MHESHPVPIAQIILAAAQHHYDIGGVGVVHHPEKRGVPEEENSDNSKQGHYQDSLQHDRTESIRWGIAAVDAVRGKCALRLGKSTIDGIVRLSARRRKPYGAEGAGLVSRIISKESRSASRLPAPTRADPARSGISRAELSLCSCTKQRR